MVDNNINKSPWEQWAEKNTDELKRQVLQAADTFRVDTLKRINELGPRGYVEYSIREAQARLLELQDPTEKDLHYFGESYFNDMTRRAKETIEYFEGLLEDDELLEAEMKGYTNRLIEIENRSNVEGELFRFPQSSYPNEFIAPKDKVTNYIFEGRIKEGKGHRLSMERSGSKKEMTTYVDINYSNLEGVSISRDLSFIDWHVHNSIVSLYILGGNEFISFRTLYRMMSGDLKGGKPSPQWEERIKESLRRCSTTRIRIDASEEAKAYKMDKFLYEGNLLYTEIVEGISNGVEVDRIRILRRPVLYDYANSKNQIARFSVKVLDTPIDKDAENMLLQSYLQKKIMDMSSPIMSRNIRYDAIYEQLKIEAASPASLRNKKSKIRATVKTILDYWIEVGFIKGHKDVPGPNRTVVSVTIEP